MTQDCSREDPRCRKTVVIFSEVLIKFLTITKHFQNISENPLNIFLFYLRKVNWFHSLRLKFSNFSCSSRTGLRKKNQTLRCYQHPPIQKIAVLSLFQSRYQGFAPKDWERKGPGDEAAALCNMEYRYFSWAKSDLFLAYNWVLFQEKSEENTGLTQKKLSIIPNTVKPVLSGPHIKRTPSVKWSTVQVPFFSFHIHCKKYLYSTDTSIKRTRTP